VTTDQRVVAKQEIQEVESAKRAGEPYAHHRYQARDTNTKLHLATRYPIRTLHTPSKRHPHHANADANLSKRQPSALLAIFFFGTSLPQNKGGGVRWGRAAAAATKIRSCHSSRSEHQGKRNKCTYEVECVTDVPIGCILNR
jgi:hypothetical protein